MKVEGFDFTNGFRCSDVHRFEKTNNLFTNILELNFYQDQDERNHNLIPIEISKKDESDRVVDLLIYKNHYALIKNLNVFLGDYHKIFICRRYLNSYTNENALINPKKNCGDDNVRTIRTSRESHVQWNKHFHKKP